MAILSTISRLIGLGRTLTDAEEGVWEHEERRLDYAMWEAYYANRVYDLQATGGFREIVLRDVLGIDCTAGSGDTPKLIGHFNPVRQLVDVYRNTIPGQYGKDIGVTDKVDGRDVNPVLLDPVQDPLGRLWRQSNLDTEKQELQRLGANLGTVGIRVVAQPGDDPRVYLAFDHPSRIVDFATDSRGNVTRVRLEYSEVMGFADEARTVKIVEEWDVESFSRTIDGEQVLDDEQRRNVLGFCPYVIYRFSGSKGFGRPCHDGTLPVIDAINWTITNQGESIYEHCWPQWFLTASGPKPTALNFGRANVWYVPTIADGPVPSATAIVPHINQYQVLQYVEKRKQEVRERQPETALGSLEMISGLSGESYAKLLIAAEDRIMAARTQLQHALKRACMMAFSYQALLGMVNFGTGTGSREAADRAFDDGLLEFEFKSQSALPLTSFDKLNQVNLDTARRSKDLSDAAAAQRLGLPDEEWMKIAGYDEERIQELLAIQRTQGVIPTDEEQL